MDNHFQNHKLNKIQEEIAQLDFESGKHHLYEGIKLHI